MKRIKNIPILGTFAIKMYNRIKKYPQFSNSQQYWEQRYKYGLNSGNGSYGKLAEFKAEIINKFIQENSINSIIEFGCGDGNQLKYFHLQDKIYTGFDVSKTIVKNMKKKYLGDKKKTFFHLSEYKKDTYQADLTLSLDVIYHLIENHTFDNYMKNLFSSSEKFVIIYSSNFDEPDYQEKFHVKNRKFTDWIEKNLPNAKLIHHIPNKYPFNGDNNTSSLADFFIYQKECNS